jgi:hypothetical protein
MRCAALPRASVLCVTLKLWLLCTYFTRFVDAGEADVKKSKRKGPYGCLKRGRNQVGSSSSSASELSICKLSELSSSRSRSQSSHPLSAPLGLIHPHAGCSGGQVQGSNLALYLAVQASSPVSHGSQVDLIFRGQPITIR